MSRLIDAGELMKAMYHRAFETDGDTMWQSGCWVRYRAIEQVVKEQPTIEPERKTGKWIPNSPVTMKCDQCGFVIKDWDWHRFNFCPNCGSYNGGKNEV